MRDNGRDLWLVSVVRGLIGCLDISDDRSQLLFEEAAIDVDLVLAMQEMIKESHSVGWSGARANDVTDGSGKIGNNLPMS